MQESKVVEKGLIYRKAAMTSSIFTVFITTRSRGFCVPARSAAVVQERTACRN